MDTIDKRDYNLAAKIFLGLSIVAFTIGCAANLINYSTYSKVGLGDSQRHLLIEAILDILLIVAAVFVFKRKKTALSAFIALVIIRMFASIPQGTNVDTSYYLGGQTVVLLRDVGLFFIALFFHKNGISGWKSFFANDEYIESHFQTSENQAILIPTKVLEENKAGVNDEDAKEEIEDIAQVSTVPQKPIVKVSSQNPKIMETEAPQIIIPIKTKAPEIPSFEQKAEPAQDNQIDTGLKAELQKRISELEKENTKLKEMYAELALEYSLLKKK